MSTAAVEPARSGRASARRAGWTSVRQAAVLALWRAAPWVLVVLLVLSLLGEGFVTWSTWAADDARGPLAIRSDGGVVAGVSLYVGLAMLATWARAIPTAVPALVAGGITRRAVTGGVLVAGTALAVVATALLTLVAPAGAALQREAAARAAVEVVGRRSGGHVFWSSLTIRQDAPEGYFNPVETLPWLVIASLGGALIGAAWYRWRARGVAGVLAVTGGAWAVYAAVVSEYVVRDATARAAEATAASPLADVMPCLVLAAGVWLVLRRTPLRQPAR